LPSKCETVDIVLQYLIWIEVKQIDDEGTIMSKKRDNTQKVSVVRAEIYMERETCYFYADLRSDKSNIISNANKKLATSRQSNESILKKEIESRGS
jgi:hypothetical protein